MKLKFPLLTAVLLLLSSFVQAQNTKAIDYNDKIVDEQSKIIVLTLEFVDLIDIDLNACETKRVEMVKQIETSILVVEKMGSFEGNSELRTAALNLFRFYKKVYSVEYKMFLDYLLKGEDITEEEVTELTEISTRIGEEEVVLDEAFAIAQENFAVKYGFVIEENELQDEIDDL